MSSSRLLMGHVAVTNTTQAQSPKAGDPYSYAPTFFSGIGVMKLCVISFKGAKSIIFSGWIWDVWRSWHRLLCVNYALSSQTRVLLRQRLQTCKNFSYTSTNIININIMCSHHTADWFTKSYFSNYSGHLYSRAPVLLAGLVPIFLPMGGFLPLRMLF